MNLKIDVRNILFVTDIRDYISAKVCQIQKILSNERNRDEEEQDFHETQKRAKSEVLGKF
jgi:hypothetical protein